MQMDSDQLAMILDTVKDAVTKSWMGEFIVYGGTPEMPTKQVNPLAYQLYLTTVTAVINRMEQIDLTPSAPRSPFDISDFKSDD